MPCKVRGVDSYNIAVGCGHACGFCYVVDSLRAVPCLIDDRVRLHPALDHPNLDGPMSHLGNTAVAALLGRVDRPQTAGDLCLLWTRMGISQPPGSLLRWFLNRGILVPDDTAP